MAAPLMLIESGDKTLDEIQKAVDAQHGQIIVIDSLGAITPALNSLPNFQLSSLDIIGHGSPGQISTGMTKTKKVSSKDPHTKEILFHLLDSDPNAYSLLWKLRETGRLSDDAPIRLLGCNTASNGDPASQGTVPEIDGRVLLFALANLIGCPVFGTTDFVDKKHFQTGSFDGTVPLISVGPDDCVPVHGDAELGDSPWSLVGGVPIGPDALPPTEDAVVEHDEINLKGDARVRGGGRKPVSIKGKALQTLLPFYTEGHSYPGGDGLLLKRDAEVRLSSGERLELLSRGRFLRLVRKRDTVLFAQKDATVRPALEAALRRAIGSARPEWLLEHGAPPKPKRSGR